MSVGTNWKGQPVVVTSTLVPRYLWQTASIDVFLNNGCVLRTGGQFKFTGSHTSHFTNSGTKHEITVRWGWARMRSFPIELSIDGEQLLKSRVYTGNWVLALWPWLIVVAFFLYWANK